VRLLEGYLSATETHALIAAADCFVSLHRAEGLGLSPAEAMARGKPVIATAYSGNLDYMTSVDTYLVDYTLREVGAGCGPYPKDAHWADADLDAAARAMRSSTIRWVRANRGVPGDARATRAGAVAVVGCGREAALRPHATARGTLLSTQAPGDRLAP
jgi:hypothetical protein